LHGRPWSLAGALTRLGAPDEPVRSRERLALDLVVRTGVRAPLRYDARAPAAAQASMAKAIESAFTPRAGQLPSGRWSYFGQPVPKTNARVAR
jgi:hypothetical protein